MKTLKLQKGLIENVLWILERFNGEKFLAEIKPFVGKNELSEKDALTIFNHLLKTATNYGLSENASVPISKLSKNGIKGLYHAIFVLVRGFRGRERTSKTVAEEGFLDFHMVGYPEMDESEDGLKNHLKTID